MQNKYAVYEEALAEELIPAMGCTEPIAIAYCSLVTNGIFLDIYITFL